MDKFFTCLIVILLNCGINLEGSSFSKKTIKLQSTIAVAPWEKHAEPNSLPKGWKKHCAKQNIIVYYRDVAITIPKGDTYFSYRGKVAIGWHGTYNPPCGM